ARSGGRWRCRATGRGRRRACLTRLAAARKIVTLERRAQLTRLQPAGDRRRETHLCTGDDLGSLAPRGAKSQAGFRWAWARARGARVPLADAVAVAEGCARGCSLWYGLAKSVSRMCCSRTTVLSVGCGTRGL